MTLGAWRLLRRDVARAAMRALPLLGALVASALALYPFGWRFLLFAAPAVLLFVAEGLEGLHAKGVPNALTAAVVLAGLCAPPVGLTLLEAAPGRIPFAAPDIRGAAQRVARDDRPGDLVYVGSYAQHLFRFYRDRVGLAQADVVYGSSIRKGIAGVLTDAQALPPAERVWAIFATHVHNQDMVHALELFDFAVKERMQLVVEDQLPGAVVRLYGRTSERAAREDAR